MRVVHSRIDNGGKLMLLHLVLCGYLSVSMLIVFAQTLVQFDHRAKLLEQQIGIAGFGMRVLILHIVLRHLNQLVKE